MRSGTQPQLATFFQIDSEYAISVKDGGILLRKARKRAGLSQRSLAAKAGVPQSTVGRIETGAIEPRIDTLLGLLHASGHDLELEARLGEGVDRGQIRERLALTPRQRLEDLTIAAAAVRRLRGRARNRAS
jgi:transcriptional regulator with XRE-family HTH domain